MAYKLISELGRGGMGTVFRARHVELNRDVAIKFVGGALEVTPANVDRFLREMSVLQGLSHPGIVRFLDAGVARDKPYLVMELLDGFDLAGILKQHGQLPLAGALDIAIQLLDALSFVHERGLVHRDIKPANVMVDVRGRAVLTDFGLVRRLDATQYTQAGHAVGTLLYISPEIIEGNPAEAPADLWACGALLYEMLAGRPAFDASSMGEAVTRILEHEPPALELIRTDVPMALIPLIKRFLEKNPARRWPDAATARTALKELADELEVGTAALDTSRATLAGQALELSRSAAAVPLKALSEVVEPQRRRSTRRQSVLPVERALRVARGIVVVLALAVGALAIVVFRPPPKPPEQVAARWIGPTTLEITARTDRPRSARLLSGDSVLAAATQHSREHRFELSRPPAALVLEAGGRAPVPVPRAPLALADALAQVVRAARYDGRRLDAIWNDMRKRELDPHLTESDRGNILELLVREPTRLRRLEAEVHALAAPLEAQWKELAPLVGQLLADPATPVDARRDLTETLDRLDAVDGLAAYLGARVPFDVHAALRPAVTLSEHAAGAAPPGTGARRAHPAANQPGPLIFMPADMLDKGSVHGALGEIMIGTKSRFAGKPRVTSFAFDAPSVPGGITLYFTVRSLFPNMRLKLTNAEGVSIPVRFPNTSALPSSKPFCLIVKLTGPLSQGGHWTVSLSRAFQTSDQFFVDVDHVDVEP